MNENYNLCNFVKIYTFELIFVFHNGTALFSYTTREKKNVTLVFSLDDNDPKMITLYNITKSEVDAAYPMCINTM